MKKVLLLLIGFGLLFASNYTNGYNYSYTFNRTESRNMQPGYNDYYISGNICITTTWTIDPYPQIRNLEHTEYYKDLASPNSIRGGVFCTDEGFSIYRPYSYGERKGIVILYLSGQMETCPTCTPQYTSEECQTEYGLVESGLLTSCQTDLNSCITNTSGFNDLLNNCSNNLNACNLSLSSCLSNNCPTTSGDISWSALYVNDQQIFGAANIYLSIPDWLNWSYNYLDSDLFVDVVNEGDPDYIEDILEVQSYHPSSEDFTVSFVGFLTLILPYVLVALFCIFVFKIVKKIFK